MNLKYLVLSILLVAMLYFIHRYQFDFMSCKPKKENMGTIIILNGPSSAGKSTLQKSIQAIFKEPYLKMGLDDLAFLPNSYISINGPVFPASEGIWLSREEKDGFPIVTIHYGPVGQKMIRGIHRTFKAFADSGNNIVVDYVLYDQDWIKDLVSVLRDYTVYFVGIDCSLATLEAREKNRGNRLIGHARSHYNTVHEYSHNLYDIRIDTEKHSPEECAHIVEELIETNKEPKAFQSLYKLFAQ